MEDKLIEYSTAKLAKVLNECFDYNKFPSE